MSNRHPARVTLHLCRCVFIRDLRAVRRVVMNNYRQISLTSIVSKIAEKIVKSRVMDFWRNINILNPSQFAYMKGRSTLSELLLVTTIGRNHATTESQLTSPFWIFPRHLTAYRMSVFFASLSVTVSTAVLSSGFVIF